MTILVAGCAGFIGWKTCEFLLKDGHTVIGIDNLNNYYDVRIRKWRLSQLFSLDQKIPLCERGSTLSFPLCERGIKGDFNKAVILKRRSSESSLRNHFYFHKIDIENYKSLKSLFSAFKPKRPIRPNKLKRLKIIYKPFHIADVPATWANINKAKRLLGWEPEYSLALGLRETVQWYKENEKWAGKIKIDLKV